jgi:hypothetical protein
MNRLLAAALALGAAFAVGGIALNRGEPINALWLVTAAVCVYALGYRFYAAWIAARVLATDATRATPAERLDNGRDYVPTPRWVVFGHHFAAIAGPGPLIGPTLAAQFGYLPGTLWILVGSVVGGCVQDMVLLFLSTRRDGRTLGQMARDELGPVGGSAALCDLVEEHGGFGAWLAAWPGSEIVKLWDELGKRFSQLGGNSGAYFLRMAGKDTFILTPSVVGALNRWETFAGEPKGKAARAAVQAAFNAWADETDMPLAHLSMTLAMSVD